MVNLDLDLEVGVPGCGRGHCYPTFIDVTVSSEKHEGSKASYIGMFPRGFGGTLDIVEEGPYGKEK